MQISNCRVHEEGHNVFVVLLAFTATVEGHFVDIIVVVVAGKHAFDMDVVME